VKRSSIWSHGILIVMFGLVVGIVGIMLALMQPFGRGALGNWSFTVAGAFAVVVGVVLASRAKIDRSLPANDKRIPSARVHRSARR
jgi:uncharacterized membrane protein HdeD (DUF308 family)